MKLSSSPLRKSKEIDPPTEDELESFFAALDSSKEKPAILKITPPYSKQFIPKLCDSSLPPPISQLYNPKALEMDYLTLLTECEDVARRLKVNPICYLCTATTRNFCHK